MAKQGMAYTLFQFISSLLLGMNETDVLRTKGSYHHAQGSL